jgi:hypothetical protein
LEPFGDLKPVKKFMDRQSAVARIWSVIQKLAEVEQPKPATTSAPAKRKAATTATPVQDADAPRTEREGSRTRCDGIS